MELHPLNIRSGTASSGQLRLKAARFRTGSQHAFDGRESPASDRLQQMILPWALAPILLQPAAPLIDERKLVDLTHTFDERTIQWPTAKPFAWHKDAWGKTAAGYWYSSASFATSEHLGTHIDSPIHFAEGEATTDRIPLRQLAGPAIVIDIARACAANRDYQLTPQDISAWEKTHGRIPAGAIALVRTGWAARWPDRERYMGTATHGDVRNLHFPGISPAAAQVFVTRRVDGVGIDTASLDHGPSTGFRTHRILNGAGIYGLENLADLERLPAAGAAIVALPMKIREGTGGPVRVIAILP
jgi:kynurenine formamidase